jgi:hypothetical protein
MLEKISLSNLIEKERIIGPLNFHDRHNLTIPANLSILQHQLEDLSKYTIDHHMVLNAKKTKCLPFIRSESKDFMPELRIDQDSTLEVIYSLKLVGLVVTSDLGWHSHIKYTVGRVNSKLWQLIRFKQLGAAEDKLVTFYILKIRSILMFGAVCFSSSLSSDLSQTLELQHKRSLAIILGSRYKNYNNARVILNLPRLDSLRNEACLKWAIKASKNPKHAHLFPLNATSVNTRNKKKYSEYFCHSSKYYKSAVPHMTRLLNSHFGNIAESVSITTNSGQVITV